ncbi:hypothetical protein SAMN05421880_10674 [Nitrosomonas nitrosa]|uniref:AAA domain-containing protein n=1 Tax=Nitrosomonas nitrosa TaxID=52442 RepID=A0A1I4N3E4_9PROT|nr:hypothetical protein [Nitrosomonas nitrosa]SFM09783.1 hypothetical protein SAMN05421880_10674 [Nitrosomonas nitrosa]
MAQSLMRITICSPATGSNFFPCGKIISRLIQVLQNEHVLFLAPRRTGKTSVLLYLQKVAPAKVVFLDLEGFDHPDLWIKSMINALGDIKDEIWVQKLKSLKNFMPRLRSDLIEIAEANWEEKANNLLKALNELRNRYLISVTINQRLSVDQSCSSIDHFTIFQPICYSY